MFRFILVPTLVILSALSIFAQTSTTPADADGQVVKISTDLIQIDVTVTGKDGQPVRDLRRDEIEIYENGKLQPISNFSFVSGARSAATAQPVNKNSLPGTVPPPAGHVRPEEVRRTIALVVDDLTLSFESSFWVREALKKFVAEQMQDGDLVAIIRTGAGVGALQQFTTDKRQLLAAIQRVRFNLGGIGKIGAFNAIRQGTGESPRPAGAGGEAVDAERDLDEFRETVFSNGTLGAMNFIVRGMRELPGRKSIMMLSDGFSMYARDERGVPNSPRILDSLRRLTDLANRASVVIYTLDAKGLQAGGLEAGDNTYGMTADQIASGIEDRKNQLFDTQQGLRFLAKQTGGFAVINQNNITKGIRRVLDDQSYYLVGYEPNDDTFDAKTRRFNKLEIRVKRPDVNVRYRSGFFGISSEQIAKPKMNAAQAIINALTSPFAVNDVNLRMNAIFASDAAQGTFVRSFINVDANDLTFKKIEGGKYTTTFDLIALNFGDNGTVLDERAKTFTLTVDEAEYQRLLKRGLVSNFTLPIKRPGGYQVRIAFRDAASKKVGSANQFVEIPNLKKNRLTISGVVLEGIPVDKWRKISTLEATQIESLSDPLLDTSLRQFRRGTVLRFAYDIYNAKLDAAGKAGLDYHATLYRDGNALMDGKTLPIANLKYESPKRLSTVSSIVIGRDLPAGDYVLRFDVTDRVAGGKKGLATQFVQFEIVD